MKAIIISSIKNTAILVILILVSGFVYVRLAPDDVTTFHVPPPVGAATPEKPIISRGGALFAQDYKADAATVLSAVEKIALATPRTKKIAGDVNDGIITFVTRSLFFGFPDYTTVRAVSQGQGTRLLFMGRLRFGRSDFGVNEARIRGWLKVLEKLNQAG